MTKNMNNQQMSFFYRYIAIKFCNYHQSIDFHRWFFRSFNTFQHANFKRITYAFKLYFWHDIFLLTHVPLLCRCLRFLKPSFSAFLFFFSFLACCCQIQVLVSRSFHRIRLQRKLTASSDWRRSTRSEMLSNRKIRLVDVHQYVG